MVEERLHREAQSQVAYPPGADGLAQHPCSRRCCEQCRWPRRSRHVGIFREDAERRIAGFRQQSGGSLNVNYPLWPEPKITPQASEAMRKRLQPHYDAKGLGAVPNPRERQARSAASTWRCSCARSRRW